MAQLLAKNNKIGSMAQLLAKNISLMTYPPAKMTQNLVEIGLMT
jgi:hypothetical protein